MRKRIAKEAAAFVSLVILACANGCFLVPHDSETRPPQPVDGMVIYFTVVDEGDGAELTRGCGVPNVRWKKIRFKAPVGSHVAETVLFERVEKEPGSVPSFSGFEEEDAFWCGKDHDVRRSLYEFKLDVACLQGLEELPPAKILSGEIIKPGPGMGGYRLGLEIVGTGSLLYNYDPGCPMSKGSELTVLKP
jgi:hypothetical protein